jgi:hypothetical protein
VTANHAGSSRSLFAALFQRIQWIVFVLAALLAAGYLAWLILAQINFLYPLWHDLISIDRTIEVYAPQNRYRQGFEQTSKAERSRLFTAIIDAIHNHGHGLRRLVYHDAAGRPLDKLLRHAEVVHLQDVARLIYMSRPFGIISTVITGVLLIAMHRQRLPVPSLLALLLGITVPLGIVAGALLIIGPVKVFYWLHTRIFPPGHEWFFYYQDSLMSTMMKAPDLFGYIGVTWAFLSLMLLLTFIGVVRAAGRR